MSHSLPAELNAAEPFVAWELQKNEAPRTTAAIQGSFLRQALSKPPYTTPGSFAKFAEAFSEVCRLLWSLHGSGIVHRNLNPDNILLAAELVMLIGFLPPPSALGASSVDAAFIGTPGYAPPEQVRGEEVFEPKSDVFALGAVLYEVLTNQIPFEGTGLELKLATITKDPLPIRRRQPACPEALIELCDSMLSKDPELRPNAQEVQERLAQLAQEFPELHLPLFPGQRNAPLTSPTPPKPEPAKPTTEEQLNRILPLRPIPVSLQPYDTRSPGALQPMIPKDRYFIEYEVGHGGIGKVSRAHDQRLQRFVAIKELIKDNFDARERFLREALLTARLQHPAIVPIYDVGVRSNGEIFYSMRLISGKPLNQLIEERETFHERLALLPHVLIIAEALAYAHTQKVIHRDLKPANILIGEFGETFLIDWGSAKDLQQLELSQPKLRPPKTPMEELVAREAIKTPELTVEGSVIGTPAYMPPEQALGKVVTESSDVYALGAILYHLLAGEAPIRDKEKPMLQQVQECSFMPLKEAQPKTPEDLLTIIQKAMSKDPKDRYPNASTFAEDLRKFQSGQLVDAHKYSVAQRFLKYAKKRKQAFSVGSAAFLLMLAGGVASLNRIIQEKRATQQSLDALKLAQEDLLKEKSVTQQTVNNLILMQARNELDHNPSKSISWIKRLPDDYKGLPVARMIASEAVRRGIPLALDTHQKQIKDISYSNNKRWLATAGADGSVHLWDTKTREEKILNETHEATEVRNIEFSSDNKLLAGSYSDGAIRVWEISTGTLAYSLQKHERGVIHCTFSPNAEYLASSGQDNNVYLWDLSTREPTLVFQSTEPVENVQFSPDGSALAAAIWKEKESSALYLYNIADIYKNKAPKVISLSDPTSEPASRSPQAKFIQFSPHGNYLVAAGFGGDLFLWHQPTQTMRQLVGHSGSISALSFSPDETSLASGGQDQTIRIWSTQTGEETAVYKGHIGGIRDLAFSHNGRLLASAGSDKTVQLWELKSNQHRVLRRHEDIVSSLSFSEDDRFLASGGYDSLLLVWDVEPKDRRVIFQQAEPVYAVAISENGTKIAAQRGNDLILWSGKDFKDEEKISTLNSTITSLVFSSEPNPNYIIIGDEKGFIYLLNINKKSINVISKPNSCEITKNPCEYIILKTIFYKNNSILFSDSNGYIKKINLSSYKTEIINKQDSAVKNYSLGEQASPAVTSLAVTSGDLLLSVGLDKTLKVWDLQTNALLKSVELGGVGYDLSLSKDEQFVAVGTSLSAVQVWKLSELLSEDKPTPRLLEGHNDLITKVSFLGDAHLLVSGSGDSTIKIWNIDNQESSTLIGHTSLISSLSVAREAKIIASSSNGGSVRVWWEEVPESIPAFLQWRKTITPPEVSDKNLSE